ncbi:MAG: hypothetical protein ACR2GY_01660 [Phycisphaerales bacterium]
MLIEVCEPGSERIGRVQVAVSERPTRVQTLDTGRDVFLNWDRAVDDAGRLRSCIVCSCRELYRHRSFPQLTAFVVMLAFAGAIVGITGVANRHPVLYIVLVAVLILDVASLIFRRERLICYQCRSRFSELEISQQHASWDRATAERHRAVRAENASAPQSAAVSNAADAPRHTPVPSSFTREDMRNAS